MRRAALVRTICLAAFLTTALTITSAPAHAAGAPTLTGSVSGDLVKGSRVTFTLRATEPDGWQNLHSLQVTMLLHGLILSQMTYYQDFDAITIRGGQLVRLGTDQSLEGSFFLLNGLDVDTLTAGNRLDLTIRVDVRQDIPEGAEFRLSATDDGGATAAVVKTAVLPKPDEGGGLGWGTLAAAVLAALFAGGLLGSVFASRRRGSPTVSVYAAIRKRIDHERSGT